jgi:integrase
MSNIPLLGKKAMTKVSATNVFIRIKTILKRACLEEKIKRNPFTGIKLEKISPKRQRLIASEVSKIYHLNMENNPKLEIDRDCFLFQVYTGLSYKDFRDLKKSDIIVTSQGYFLNTSRIKTHNPVRQFLIEPAIELIVKYKNNPTVLFRNGVLPCKHLNKYNINLKIIASMCEISKNLSTHIARHTCCQLLGNAGVRHQPVINCILGWGDNQKSMLFNYNEVYDENLIEARNTYNNYLKNNI